MVDKKGDKKENANELDGKEPKNWFQKGERIINSTRWKFCSEKRDYLSIDGFLRYQLGQDGEERVDVCAKDGQYILE